MQFTLRLYCDCSEPNVNFIYIMRQYLKTLPDHLVERYKNWKKNGWKTASKKPVKNKELWVELDRLIQKHTVSWKWVKGHSGHLENERADELANEAITNNI